MASGAELTVQVTAKHTDFTKQDLSDSWGPYLIADGAIIDLTFEM